MLTSLINILNHPLNKGAKINAFFRILWWKLNQLTYKLPCIVNLTPNRKCICYPDSSSGGLIIYEKLFDYEEMTYLLKNLTSHSLFIDVGANIGEYSLLASSIITQNSIYAFEPDKEVAQKLRENIRLNNLNNIEVYQQVLSDRVGIEYFDLEKESEVNHIAYKKSSSSLKIKSITLDEFARNKQIRTIDFLKIDVEGAEMKVLKGSKDLLKSKIIKIILLELNKNNKIFGTTNQQVVAYLHAFGYKIYKVTEAGKLKRLFNVSNDDITNVVCKCSSHL